MKRSNRLTFGLLIGAGFGAGQVTAAGKDAPAAQTVATDALTICLQSWDAATHMSKREWAVACRRTVKEFPSVFSERL
jgi:hypothetical protein